MNKRQAAKQKALLMESRRELPKRKTVEQFAAHVPRPPSRGGRDEGAVREGDVGMKQAGRRKALT